MHSWLKMPFREQNFWRLQVFPGKILLNFLFLESFFILLPVYLLLQGMRCHEDGNPMWNTPFYGKEVTNSSANKSLENKALAFGMCIGILWLLITEGSAVLPQSNDTALCKELPALWRPWVRAAQHIPVGFWLGYLHCSSLYLPSGQTAVL